LKVEGSVASAIKSDSLLGKRFWNRESV